MVQWSFEKVQNESDFIINYILLNISPETVIILLFQGSNIKNIVHILQFALRKNTCIDFKCVLFFQMKDKNEL